MKKAISFRQVQDHWNTGSGCSALTGLACAYLDELAATLPDDLPIRDHNLHHTDREYMDDKLARILSWWPDHPTGIESALPEDQAKTLVTMFTVIGHGAL